MILVGDTITLANNPAEQPLKGYKNESYGLLWIVPIDNRDYNDLREALEKLQLNDASLEFEPESSQALGFGYRTGFLGMLHMEIIQERIEREFGIELIATAPSVIYQCLMKDGSKVTVDNPAQMPERDRIESIYEPYVRATMMVPNDYVGAVMELCQRKRGQFINMDYLDDIRVNIVYEIPLSEVVFDFFDQLKSNTKGYASFDYEFIENKESNLVKMDILLNGDKVDALSFIVHRDFAYERGKALVEKLKTLIPRQQFEVPVQAAIGQKLLRVRTLNLWVKCVIQMLWRGH